MSVYIALLRGINVGGKNIIKMADLRQVFETMGFSGVQTYIQSGNVFFKSGEEEEPLRKKIECRIEEVFGFFVPIVIRTAEELEKIILNCPFTEKEISEAKTSQEGESFYVSMLTHAPSQERVESLEAYRNENDKYQVEGREVYLLVRHGIRNSRLASSLQKLDVPATVRNWNTVNKLALLAKAMKD